MAPTGKANPRRNSADRKHKSSDSGAKPAKLNGQSQAPPVQISDEVPSFPGGGGSKLIKRKRDSTRAEVDDQFDDKGKRRKMVGAGQPRRTSAAGDEASAFESSEFTHSDFKPGMIVKGKIIDFESSDAIVQFPSGVEALCPLQHMSEFVILNPRKKFKVGAELVFRVLKCKERITLTHKKTLLKSKLSIVASYADATDGLITHGWISKIKNHGCFVKFYNGVHGFAPRAELVLEGGCDPSSMYHVGQVVKCRVASDLAARHRINLSFITSPTRVSKDEMDKLGSLVSGVVKRVNRHAVVLYVNTEGNIRGTISNEHLADHQGHAARMKSVLKPGHQFSDLLVLGVEGNNLVLSAKYSLVRANPQLPREISEINPCSVLQGYVSDLIETGCNVRFLGCLTAFSPRKEAMDDSSAKLSEAFYVGQSVRANVLRVDGDTGQIAVSLKQSSCSSTDASFIQSYFLTEEKIADFQASDSSNSKMKAESFNIGSIVECNIREAKESGVDVCFENYTGVVGFIPQAQLCGRTLEAGTSVHAAVLDISMSENRVDLSLKPEFVNTSKKKHKRIACKELKMHSTIKAIVEIVKDDYLVLSLPEHSYAIAYASVMDYNTQKLPQKRFINGESVTATVMALPAESLVGRTLLLLESLRLTFDSSSSTRSERKSGYDVGSLVQAEKSLRDGKNQPTTIYRD